jgi:hypothetical protein
VLISSHPEMRRKGISSSKNDFFFLFIKSGDVYSVMLEPDS